MKWILANKRHISRTNALVWASQQLRGLLKCLIVPPSRPLSVFSLLQWKTHFALVHRYPKPSFVMSLLCCPWASRVGRSQCVHTQPNACIYSSLASPLHKHPLCPWHVGPGFTVQEKGRLPSSQLPQLTLLICFVCTSCSAFSLVCYLFAILVTLLFLSVCCLLIKADQRPRAPAPTHSPNGQDPAWLPWMRRAQGNDHMDF